VTTAHVVIDCHIDDVFTFLSDLKNAPRWAPGVVSVAQVAGDGPGPGALYDVVRLFGRSSHARADGLYDEHNDDEHDIWQHAIDNKYAAVVTADADFLRISQFHRNRMTAKYGSLKACPEHIPALIYFERPMSKNETIALLEQNQSTILKFLRSNDAVALKITEDGCEKIYKHTHGKGMKNGDDGLDHSGPGSAPAP